jgi:lipooligosaccharide transport system permease protein
MAAVVSVEAPRGPDPAGARRTAAAPALTIRAFRCWLTVYRRTWRSSIWSSVLGPVCYLGAMGFGLGSLVDKHGVSRIGGVPYLAFLAPAILASSAMTTALDESTFPVYGSTKWNKIYIAAQETPLRPADIFRGHLVFRVMRITLNVSLVMARMAAFGAPRSAWVILALPAAVLTGVAFAAPIAAWAVTIKSDGPFAVVFRFGMIPLMLFSGTFFPLSQLPGWLRPLAYATPLWHGVALCREFSLGQMHWLGIGGHVLYLVGLAGIGIWAGTRTYRGRLYV